MENKDVRWIQRLDNYKKAFVNLQSAIVLSKERLLSDLEKQGLIQAFEFSFELAWKLIKDYLEFMQVEAKFPREVIKQGFQYDLIDNGDIWMDMLQKRNLMAHTCDEANARLAYELISKEYYSQLEELHKLFIQKEKESE